MPTETCGHTMDTGDLKLVCTKPNGHAGPTHGDGENEWGDPSGALV